jgi:hypothetical protein
LNGVAHPDQLYAGFILYETDAFMLPSEDGGCRITNPVAREIGRRAAHCVAAVYGHSRRRQSAALQQTGAGRRNKWPVFDKQSRRMEIENLGISSMVA